MTNYEIPIWYKANLNIEEAALYFNIGENKLRTISKDEAFSPYFLCIGNKRLVKRKMFERHLESVTVL